MLSLPHNIPTRPRQRSFVGHLQSYIISADGICNNCRVRISVTTSGVRDTFRPCGSANGRVATRDQHPEAQHDALTAAGCDEIFIDKVSGKLASRPELDKALLSANRAGDHLVVTKLDRLGRSLEHLIELSKLLQGHATSTAVGCMFFQILGGDRGVRARPDVRAHHGWPGRRSGARPHRRAKTKTRPAPSNARPADV
jgi:hypothetical protein